MRPRQGSSARVTTGCARAARAASAWRAASPVALAAALVAGGCTSADDAATIGHVRALTAIPAAAVVGAGREDPASWKRTRAFYEARGFRPAWVEDGRPGAALDALITALTRADTHGLDPRTYNAAELTAARRRADRRWLGPRIDADRVAVVDVMATDAFLHFAADLLFGRAAPRDVHPRWRGAKEAIAPEDVLREALASTRIIEALADLAPAHAQYLALQQALADTRVRLASAQGREAAGLRWRITQIEMNLDRWRWFPRDLGDRYVLVNVPAYELFVMDRDRPVLSMRVVVGAPASPTPVFSDRMTHVVFSPYWNIPESIMREETVPRVVDNPDYLAEAGIEVVRNAGGEPEPVDPAAIDWSVDLGAQGYRLRQVPGPENALGSVKFLFPNRFNVYLHDTPSTAPFERPMRALSHGCIRLEQPVQLARYILADQPEWNTDSITAAMRGSEERVVRVDASLPVHLGYWTVWVASDGRLAVTGDPYRVDRQHARVLARRAAARTG